MFRQAAWRKKIYRKVRTINGHAARKKETWTKAENIVLSTVPGIKKMNAICGKGAG